MAQTHTGLRIGRLEEVTTSSSSSIHKDVFQGRSIITTKDDEEAFLNISSCQNGKGELTLKLALLYFLYGTLLTPSTNKIDGQYIYLIEDLQNFNAFPSGRVAYDFFVSSILQLRLHMGGIINPVRNFNIYGFCFALQAWAYEVMPSVAAYCPYRVNNFENVTPWILRWSATRILRSDHLKIFCPLGDRAHLNNTMENWEELSTDAFPHVAKQKKRKLLSDNDQMPNAQPSSAGTPPPPSTGASTYSSHHLAHRLSRAEGMLESLLRKVEQPILDISHDEIPRNEFPRVDGEKDKSADTLSRHSTSGSHPISMNKAKDKHATTLSEPANDNPKTNAHLVQSEIMHPSCAAIDVVIICDSEGDDDEVVVASASQSKDSDNDAFLSDWYMNKLV